MSSALNAKKTKSIENANKRSSFFIAKGGEK